VLRADDVLHGCETWFIAEHKKLMFENEMLKNIFGSKEDEVTF
jgi:hypothetical protein